MKEERIAIFIDGSNFYHGLKALFGSAKIDFVKLAEKLCAGGRWRRAISASTRFFCKTSRYPLHGSEAGTVG